MMVTPFFIQPGRNIRRHARLFNESIIALTYFFGFRVRVLRRRKSNPNKSGRIFHVSCLLSSFHFQVSFPFGTDDNDDDDDSLMIMARCLRKVGVYWFRNLQMIYCEQYF